jgi:hypothetical protein
LRYVTSRFPNSRFPNSRFPNVTLLHFRVTLLLYLNETDVVSMIEKKKKEEKAGVGGQQPPMKRYEID